MDVLRMIAFVETEPSRRGKIDLPEENSTALQSLRTYCTKFTGKIALESLELSKLQLSIVKSVVVFVLTLSCFVCFQ